MCGTAARKAVTLAVLGATLLGLTGCGGAVDQGLRKVGLGPRRVTTPGPQIQTAEGPINLYWFKEGFTCGHGYQGRSGGGESSSGCGALGALTFSGGGTSEVTFWYGRVNDPRIVRVTLALGDGPEWEATLGGGMWYVAQPGGNQLAGPPPRLRGLDADGNLVISLP